MRQRFRLYFTLWLWTLTGIGVMFFVSPEGKNPVQAKDPWIFAALFLCGIYDVWRRVRRVSLHSGAGLLELRRGAEVVLQTPWSEVALWSPFQNLRRMPDQRDITLTRTEINSLLAAASRRMN